MFGGSFNPVHNAHTEFAEAVIKSENLDAMYIVPTYSSPHKLDFNMASPEHRFNMCKIAFKNVKNTQVSDIEIKRRGTSYTCDTLRKLKNFHPNDRLFLVVGADMYVTLQSWKNPEDIFKIAEIITFPRNDDNYGKLIEHSKKLAELGAKTKVLNKPVMFLSSTDIRQNIKNRSFVKEHLNSDVYEYIVNNKLYGM